ncbi:ankyrin repeat domain-containing protein [Brachyspira aalborgi]|uniref:Ankyrin repeat domain-containing protein n=2 Tax=Brachyspira aalborgi TaxID=29522 RepID=A0A5C8GAV7_9SPIR|nr:ankyrin repeat domain-containing protein [Brachyspira aalborgi]TXJ59103.1 ankyrin repeat domain-containing protein [Brachyspira aalborgi]
MTLKEALKLYEGQEGVKEIKSLIKKGINARYLTDRKEDKNFMQNMCPIHIAARFGYKEIVKALIENGADINIKGYFGYTALHEACRKNNIDIVNILIKNGTDLNIKSGRHGFMPLYLACENNYEEIIDILIKNGANLGLEPNHKVWRLDLPYREEEYFMERTSNYFQFVYEEEDLSEPCEITTDVPFYFENMLPYSTIYVQSGYEKWKHKIYFYKKYNDFYGEDSYCRQYNEYARANRFMKGGKFPHDDYFHFSIYQQEITDGKNYFIITHFALMSRKIDKEFILWLVENFNSIPVEEGTMNSFDDLNKIKLCKKGVTYYLSYNGSLYAFMTMDKYIFVVCEIRDLTKRSKKFMRLAIYMTGERYSINRKPELLEEEEEDRIKRMKITIKKYSRKYLKFIKEVAKYLEIKGYKKNKDYKIYSDENIIENMAELYGYNNNYVRNIKIIKNDIVSLSSNYTDKNGVAYYLGLTVSSYNEKLKKKTIKIKNAVKKFMFYKFQYKFKEKEDFGEYRLFYKIRVKKDNPEEIAEAMIKLYGILKSKKIKYKEDRIIKRLKKLRKLNKISFDI